ncbi:FxLD family lanthipeptide [Nocardiopsis chromatogenes]|uniref:FxLD family lanthipeptide n=1 Tax=Nocardiopsis chromatogenes TaxID=280239 RepID=UPI00034CDC19|nr:FxLD family lanthipeptide [Nocardiopsis chromatogenes]
MNTDATAAPEGFDLDIRLIETSDEAESLINLTEDNCGSSCPNACTGSYVD